jgi:hypothetical protein
MEGVGCQYLGIWEILKGLFLRLSGYRLFTPSYSCRKAALLLLTPLISSLLLSCGSGDDDGNRLAEQIVGTWYRGWSEGDVEIIGDVDVAPEDFIYYYFTFAGDGSYNGMVRDGSFTAYDIYDNTIYTGTYKCDNDNLRLEYTEAGRKQKIQARVLSFDEKTLMLEYKNTDLEVPVTVRLKLSTIPTTPPELF